MGSALGEPRFDNTKRGERLITKTAQKLIVLLITVFVLTVPAYGQDCDSLVADQANIFGKNITKVRGAALNLQNIGAEPRIRTFPRGQNLHFIEKDIETQCQSWRSIDGGRKNYLVVLMVSI